MRWPTSLKIGAHEYKLLFLECWDGQNSADLGETDYEKQEIRIRAGMAETTEFSTVIHEVLHVINSQLDHVLLESLAEQISQVLLENGLIDEDA